MAVNSIQLIILILFVVDGWHCYQNNIQLTGIKGALRYFGPLFLVALFDSKLW